MTDLQRYRQDIIKNSLRLEVFCADLVEEFKNRNDAEKWFYNYFTPAFENAIMEKFIEEKEE